MKIVKRALALVLSLAMMASTLTVSAADEGKPSQYNIKLTEQNATFTVPEISCNGKTQLPKLTVKYTDPATNKSFDLVEGEDFVVLGPNKEVKNAGTYTVRLVGIGHYSFNKEVSFTVKANPTEKVSATVFASAYSVKAKKNAKVKLAVVSKSQGKRVYKVVNGPSKKKVVVKSNGRIYFKKGAKKGVYTIKVTVKANNNYKKIVRKIKIRLV